MPNEAIILWDRIVRKFGKCSGDSRHIAKDILRGPAEWVVLGAEYQPPNANYRWNGLDRRAALSKRWSVFQWTLEGEGLLRVGRKSYPQTPGTAFAVQVPSDHEYRVARKESGWKFLFIRIDDPWICDRLCSEARKINWTFPLDSKSALGTETLHFFEQTYSGALQDPFEADRATGIWCVEFRRHIYNLLHPRVDRLMMLEAAAAFFQENKTRSFGVEDFASSIGMTRSQASIHFHKLTGQTPAAFFLELRLREAIDLLGEGLKLEAIAKETGFSDANHLCKSFRRIYHTTPGEFRRKRWPSGWNGAQ